MIWSGEKATSDVLRVQYLENFGVELFKNIQVRLDKWL